MHFLSNVMGSVNRPNLGIYTSTDMTTDRRRRKEPKNKTTTGIRSGAAAVGDALKESPLLLLL